MDTLLVNMLDVNLSIQSFHQYMYFSTQFENTVTKPIVCAQQLLTLLFITLLVWKPGGIGNRELELGAVMSWAISSYAHYTIIHNL